jgi:hypothetical protein
MPPIAAKLQPVDIGIAQGSGQSKSDLQCPIFGTKLLQCLYTSLLLKVGFLPIASVQIDLLHFNHLMPCIDA